MIYIQYALSTILRVSLNVYKLLLSAYGTHIPDFDRLFPFNILYRSALSNLRAIWFRFQLLGETSSL